MIAMNHHKDVRLAGAKLASRHLIWGILILAMPWSVAAQDLAQNSDKGAGRLSISTGLEPAGLVASGTKFLDRVAVLESASENQAALPAGRSEFEPETPEPRVLPALTAEPEPAAYSAPEPFSIPEAMLESVESVLNSTPSSASESSLHPSSVTRAAPENLDNYLLRKIDFLERMVNLLEQKEQIALQRQADEKRLADLQALINGGRN